MKEILEVVYNYLEGLSVKTYVLKTTCDTDKI
jgi:hypothetical protein